MKVLPLPFENDDEEAAAIASGTLAACVQEAKSKDAQDQAVAVWKAFADHERAKRLNNKL